MPRDEQGAGGCTTVISQEKLRKDGAAAAEARTAFPRPSQLARTTSHLRSTHRRGGAARILFSARAADQDAPTFAGAVRAADVAARTVAMSPTIASRATLRTLGHVGA